MLEITGTALYYEGQGNASLGMLRSLVEELGTVSGRKTLVLISAGMMASDVPGGRPDISELGHAGWARKPRARTRRSTRCISTPAHGSLLGRGPQRRQEPAERSTRQRGAGPMARSVLRARPAARCSRCRSASGEGAFDRISKEISAYYLLGVEPRSRDRDGRTHEVKVKTTLKKRHDPRPALGHDSQARRG